jgi:hypothetical protein
MRATTYLGTFKAKEQAQIVADVAAAKENQ